MAGMGGGAMFLIIILSVFNGFEGLVKKLYNAFYPDIKIMAIEGKTFAADTSLINLLKQVNGVLYITRSLEENAYLKYKEKENIATIKGVEDNFKYITGIDTFILYGKYELENQGRDQAILGAAIDEVLNTEMEQPILNMQIMVPKKGRKVYINPEDAFEKNFAIPVGVFAIQQEFDSKYVILPYRLTEELLNEHDRASSIEIKVKSTADINATISEIQTILGKNFKVKDRLQQNETLYKVVKTERLAVYIILSFIMFIISFNIIGSLSMLVLDKQKDISILKAMGATPTVIRNIFLLEGLLSSAIGALIGLFLGFIICLVQQKFGLVKLQGSGSFIIDAYPVEMHLSDFLLAFLIVIAISFLASIYPANKAAKRDLSMK
jgi:lipoprotein-releasing system permease protein